MVITFDSNILIYAYNKDSYGQRDIARDLVLRAMALPSSLVLTLQALGEFYQVATRKQKESPDRVRQAIARLHAVFPITTPMPSTIFAAIDANREHGIQFWNAMIWATARQVGVTHVLSEDFQDGRTLGGVTFVNPFNPTNAELVDRLLPPVT
ncbi:MAG: hypothetical protein RLY86_2671 [Pseudomonadota bacterium]|jgi:predicted nucleic acid-binding protein